MCGNGLILHMTSMEALVRESFVSMPSVRKLSIITVSVMIVLNTKQKPNLIVSFLPEIMFLLLNCLVSNCSFTCGERFPQFTLKN